MLREATFCLHFLAAASLGCIDGGGKSTDFWFSFKYPDGWDYAYMTKGHALEKADGTMDDDKSPVSRTLNKLYAGHKGLSYAMWNDEYPTGKKIPGPHAHAKGVLAFDGNSGFWLTHSLPEFPSAASKKNPGYSTASDKYGQSFLCITIDKAALSTLATVFSIDWLAIYDSDDNAKLGEDFTNWAVDFNRDKDHATKVSTIKSAGGQRFTLYGKSGDWGDALYDTLVAPHLKAAMYTETWQNGRGKMKSACGLHYTVENIKSVKFPGAAWRETQDHSKWAVSKQGTAFCVGDINRQEGQSSRGGGTVCIALKELHDHMSKVIDDVEACGSALDFANVTAMLV